jgi:hypothetical protein
VDPPYNCYWEEICQNRFGAAKVRENRLKMKKKSQNKKQEIRNKEQGM